MAVTLEPDTVQREPIKARAVMHERARMRARIQSKPKKINYARRCVYHRRWCLEVRD